MVLDLNSIRDEIRRFNVDRDWDKFHNIKDLIIALTSEVGELAECYRWLTAEEISTIHSTPEKKKKVEEEIADILIYLLIISYKADINVLEVAKQKLEKNKLRYPIDKSKSVHSNPILGFKGNN